MRTQVRILAVGLGLGVLGVIIGLVGSAQFDDSPGVRSASYFLAAVLLLAGVALILRGYFREARNEHDRRG